MTPFCCLCLPSLMRKLAVKERGNMSRLSVSSIKLIPFLDEETKYDTDLVNWIYQIVYTRRYESISHYYTITSYVLFHPNFFSLFVTYPYVILYQQNNITMMAEHVCSMGRGYKDEQTHHCSNQWLRPRRCK